MKQLFTLQGQLISFSIRQCLVFVTIFYVLKMDFDSEDK